MNNKEEEYQKDILERYANCMAEIKRRHEGIMQYLYHGLKTPFPITDIEFICLQFRKTFELIILASMVANKDEYAKQRAQFATDWSASRIIKTIEAVNPDFYPIPTKQVIDKETRKVIRTDIITEGFLTKEELIDALNLCADYLHADNPFSDEKNLKVVEEKFDAWLKRTVVLLNHHQLQLTHSDYQIWCLMKGGNGDVQTSLFKRINVSNSNSTNL